MLLATPLPTDPYRRYAFAPVWQRPHHFRRAADRSTRTRCLRRVSSADVDIRGVQAAHHLADVTIVAGAEMISKANKLAIEQAGLSSPTLGDASVEPCRDCGS